MAEGSSPRKAKRTAEHQINKDEDPEGDGTGEEVVAGTFQRAPAEVLKTRKEQQAPVRQVVPPSPQNRRVVNGEELEECTFKARGKLFRLSSKEWVEKGIGNMKVLRSNAAGEAGSDETGDVGGGPAAAMARLVMRREAGQQVMINVPLQAQTKCSMQGDKALLLACFTPEGPATYLIKVKTPDIAGSLKAAIDALVPPAEGDSAA
eukprot:g11154.t1